MNAKQVGQHPRVTGGQCLTLHRARRTVIYDHKKASDQAAGDLRVEGRCYVRQPDEDATDYDFTIHNPGGKLFHLVAVDKCLFSDQDSERRCDCLVFTADVALFIDLKENKSVRSRKQGRREAIEQICGSIEWFLAEGLLTDREQVVVIVANGTRKRHLRFTTNNIAKTAELEELFPNLFIEYDELPFRKL